MNNLLYVAYHDWGRPLHDDCALFELLCMETYLYGLSWERCSQTPGLPSSFSRLLNSSVGDMTDEELEVLMNNPYHPHCAKILPLRANAQAFTSSERVWLFWFISVFCGDGKTMVNDILTTAKHLPVWKISAGSQKRGLNLLRTSRRLVLSAGQG